MEIELDIDSVRFQHNFRKIWKSFAECSLSFSIKCIGFNLGSTQVINVRTISEKIDIFIKKIQILTYLNRYAKYAEGVRFSS